MDGFIAIVGCVILSIFAGYAIPRDIPMEYFGKAQAVRMQNGGVLSLNTHGTVACKNGAKFTLKGPTP